MTELRSADRDGCSLISETAITDGNGHRIGLMRGGSHRTLYVDDVAIAEDTQDSLKGSDSGPYIDSGKGMEPATF